MKNFKISYGIMAYNEEANIGKLLQAALNQELSSGELVEIAVVASGCTDRTEEIVKQYAEQDKRVILLAQPSREGKASAINYWLSRLPQGIDICVMESADTLPNKDTVEKLVAPFADPQVGMTGTRPMPSNDPETFMGFMAHIVWDLHHKIALQYPKMGEMVAFRNLVSSIPMETPVDEVSIEAVITQQELVLRYIPEAVVTNRGPQTVQDYLKQRRRIYSGHLYLRRSLNYAPPTMQGSLVFKELLGLVPPRKIAWGIAAIGLEMTGRFLGMYDYHIKKKLPYKWDIAESTKEP